MRIGIYARGISGKVGGAKEYIKSMTKAIIKNIKDNDELYIFHNLDKKYFNSNKKNVHEILLNSKNKIFCDFVLAPCSLNKLDLDVVLFPKNVVPFLVNSKKIVMVHDLAHFMPEYNAYPLIDTLYMKKMIKNSCKKSDKIIAVSENTKKDIVNILKIPESKIKVIYEAADEKYKIIIDKEKISLFRKKYNLCNKYILFTGGISPRKNLIRFIKAFNQISNKIPHKLVITGGKGWKNKDELKMINKTKKVMRIGFVKDEDMPYLYNLADLYVYPSLYEGFGLPILEAQACGCPVVCSNLSSIPEVAGNSVLYFNPYKIKDIGDKIMMLAKNESLKKDLIKKGFKNVKRFSWKKEVKQLLKVIENVAKEK